MSSPETLAYKGLSKTKLIKTNASANGNASGRVLLVSCGSFSPITYMHLRMFEIARDYVHSKNLSVVGGFFSPVGDAYGKKDLARAAHRYEMVKRATDSSDWINVDGWESTRTEYTRTLHVLEHFSNEINSDNSQDPIFVRLICGADLLESMRRPGVWHPEDIAKILKDYGVLVLERITEHAQETIEQIIQSDPILAKHKDYIHIVQQTMGNDISSTGIRTLIRANRSIKYLTPDSVIEYINEHGLFRL
eukprot:TRINITY_DN18196_c0_g1_i1.p1 TRINITY_DN18196_c0_g1~~TRINITY_DN18196_c0_g1_i1.p1  ORF type:complete len:256 (-),score=25.94 TRINITY_DN18196_c0_g1_i1:35-781(-)